MDWMDWLALIIYIDAVFKTKSVYIHNLLESIQKNIGRSLGRVQSLFTSSIWYETLSNSTYFVGFIYFLAQLVVFSFLMFYDLL